MSRNYPFSFRFTLCLCVLAGASLICGCYKPLKLSEKAPHFAESRFFVDPDVKVYGDFQQECRGQETLLYKAAVERLTDAGFRVVTDSAEPYDFKLDIQAEEEKKSDFLDRMALGPENRSPRNLPYDPHVSELYRMENTHQYTYRVRTALERDGQRMLVVTSYSTIPDCIDFFGVVAADIANELVRALVEAQPEGTSKTP